jgi:hypothetical protein
MKQKQEFLGVVLRDGFESQVPLLYEKSVIVLSEIIGADYANKNQIISLSPLVKAIRSLNPKKSIENTQYT